MKPYLNLQRLALLCVAASLIIVGCDVSNLADDIEDALDVKVSLPGTEVDLVVQILDATTGDLIEEPVNVRLEGEDAALIIDPLFFEPIQNTTTEVGVVNLAVASESVPTEADPLRINVVVSSDGYVTTGQSLLIVGEEANVFEIRMISLTSAPPSGVALTSQSSGQTDNQGAITSDVTVTTPAESQTGATASISIPAGTVIRDVNNQPLQGALTATVAYFSPQDGDALTSFPGGFDGITVQRADGSTENDGAFITGGFVSFDIFDGAGRRAENFSNNVSITVDVPPGLTNPTTGQPVQSGDIVPIWSYDEETGNWAEEGQFTASKNGEQGFLIGEPNARGNLPVKFEVNHLSYKNIDWFDSASGTCRFRDGGLRINLSNFPGITVTARITAPGLGYAKTAYVTDNFLTLYNFSRAATSITVQFFLGNTSLGSTTVSDPCGQTTSFTLQGLPTFVSVDLSVNVVCSSQEITALPTVWLRVRKQGERNWQWLRIENGRLQQSGLEQGAIYDVIVYYLDNGRWQTQSETITVEGTPVNGVISISRSFVDNAEICSRL
ncbi:MAG: hypothetical protein AAGJ10_16415 [Bacteroidota bacterium]